MLTEPVICQALAAAVATSIAIPHAGVRAGTWDMAARGQAPHLGSPLSGGVGGGGSEVKFGKENLSKRQEVFLG